MEVGKPSWNSDTCNLNKSMSRCFHHLPEDLVVKILIRLPVKSLIRFTCVSKRWRSIISDPRFGKSHLQLASQLRTVSRKVLLISLPFPWLVASHDPFKKFPPRFQSLDDKFAVNNFTFPSHEESVDMIQLGSCNGLILLGQRQGGGYRNLSIWNPSTGFFRKIPNPTASTDKQYIGFGHVSACDDYKLVVIKPPIGDLLKVRIFSVKANMWRVITTPYSLWPGWLSGQGTFSNGAVHWVNGSYDYLNQVIYAFDLAEEDFRQVPLPHLLRPNERDRNCAEIKVIEPLVHLGGSLCILSRKRFSRQEGEVWVMIEYGVPESWVKLFRFDLSKVPGDLPISFDNRVDLCFITEDGTMVIKRPKELYWIECRNEEKPICSRRYRLEDVRDVVPKCSFCCHAIGYDETLVSIAE